MGKESDSSPRQPVQPGVAIPSSSRGLIRLTFKHPTLCLYGDRHNVLGMKKTRNTGKTHVSGLQICQSTDLELFRSFRVSLQSRDRCLDFSFTRFI